MLGSASLSATSREIDGSAHLFGRSSALSFSAGRFILIGSFVSAHALPSPLPTALQPACFVVKDDVEPMWSNNISKKTSKEIGMPTRRFELAQLLVSGCAVVFGLIELAQAQPGYVPPPTPLPPPVFNPSNPGTVPQPSYRPITPSTPSTVPSVEVTSPTVRRGEVMPANEELPRRTARHPRASVHRAASYGLIAIGPPPVAYSYVGYGYPCAWQRSWDGYWFRTSPCSW